MQIDESPSPRARVTRWRVVRCGELVQNCAVFGDAEFRGRVPPEGGRIHVFGQRRGEAIEERRLVQVGADEQRLQRNLPSAGG